MRKRFIAAALTAIFLFIAFCGATIYARGGVYDTDYLYDNNDIAEPEYPAYEPPPVVEKTLPPVERPFTPPGTGTVVDNVTNEDGKEFFTITSAAGNIFFLIIDRQRGQDNVYFLNVVTERDLLALAEQSGDTWEDTSIPPPIIPCISIMPELEIEIEPEPVPEPEPEQSNNAGMMILLVIIVIGGVAGYYFKIFRPKQQSADMTDDYDYSDEDDYYSEPLENDTPLWDMEDEDNEGGNE